jgi:aspartate aminotransferase-like enzyme
MEAIEQVTANGLERAFQQFAATADATERAILARALECWAEEYPKADHEEELTIATSFRRAEGDFYAGVIA